MKTHNILRLSFTVLELSQWGTIKVNASGIRGSPKSSSHQHRRLAPTSDGDVRYLSSIPSVEDPLRVYDFDGDGCRANWGGLGYITDDPLDGSNKVLTLPHSTATGMLYGAPEEAQYLSFRIFIKNTGTLRSDSTGTSPCSPAKVTANQVSKGVDLLDDTKNFFEHPGQEQRWFTCFARFSGGHKITLWDSEACKAFKDGEVYEGDEKAYYDDFVVHKSLGFPRLEDKLDEISKPLFCLDENELISFVSECTCDDFGNIQEDYENCLDEELEALRKLHFISKKQEVFPVETCPTTAPTNAVEAQSSTLPNSGSASHLNFIPRRSFWESWSGSSPWILFVVVPLFVM